VAPNPTATEASLTRRWLSLRPWPWALLAWIAVLVYFAGATTRELHGTKVFYAALSRQVFETGVWDPILHGDVPYVLKPPLQFWLTALTMHVLGPTSLAATFWARLLALASIALTADLGRRFFGPAAGFLAAVLMITNSTLIENANTFRLEAAQLFGVVLAVWAAVIPKGRWRAPLCFGGVAFAMLSKGVPGALPLLLVPLYLAWSRRDGDAPSREPLHALPWSWLLLLPAIWLVDQALRLHRPVLEQLATDATRSEVHGAAEHLRGVL
jgi:4-amino-4-deoxy-L-arabinose transferase-like glycosyltransferase